MTKKINTSIKNYEDFMFWKHALDSMKIEGNETSGTLLKMLREKFDDVPRGTYVRRS